MKRLIVSVSGGVVEIGEVPEGLIVEVRDYDVDECNAHNLPKDECKECFKEIEWSYEPENGEPIRGADYCFWYEIEGADEPLKPLPIADLPNAVDFTFLRNEKTGQRIKQ